MNLVRSCDDVMMTGSSKEWLETEVNPLVEAFVQERGRALAPEKTRLTQMEDGCDFLGHHRRRYQDGKMLITPAKKTVEAV